MKKLVSLLLAVCLLIPCAFAETAETDHPQAMNLILSNAYFTMNGERFDLNPTAAINATLSGDDTLVDLYLESDGAKLFPMQFRLSEEGVALLIGSSKNVYLFDALLMSDMLGITGQDITLPEYFSSADPDYELMMESYEALAAEPMSHEAVEAFLAAHEAIEGRGAGVPGTVTIEEEAYDATVYAYTLSSEQYRALSDVSTALLGEGFWSANHERTLLFHGIEEPLTEEELQQRLYSEITAQVTEYRLTGFDGAVIERVITAVSAETGETEIRTIRYTLDGDSGQIGYEQILDTARMSILRREGKALITTVYDDPYEPASDTVEVTKVDGGFRIRSEHVVENTVLGMTDSNVITTFETENEFSLEGSYLSEYDDGTRMEMIMALSGADEYHADGTIDIFMNQKLPLADGEEVFLDMEMGCALSAAAIDNIDDRITGAKVTTISTEEDLTGSSGLMLALMGLMGDAERLMNEDSVAAMLEGIEAASAKMTEEYTYDYGEYEGIEIPTVNVPDNFILVDGTQLYGYDSILDTSVYRDGTDLLSVTIAADTALKSYLDANLSEEEAAAPSLPRDVSVDIRENYARAIVLHDEYTIVIEAFNGAADYSLLGQLIADIEFPVEEETSEEEPVPAPVPGGGKGIKGGHTL